jgi:hypothetical protein
VSDRGRNKGCIGPEPGWQTVGDFDERVDCERPEQSLVDERDGRLTVEDETNSFVSNWLAVDNANLSAHAEVNDQRVPAVQRTPDELAPPNRGVDSGTRQGRREILGAARVALQSARITNEYVGDPRANEVGEKPAADDLDLGEFGHV